MEFRFEYHDELHRVELDDGEHLLGRAPDAAFRLTSRRVSARHAMLRIDGDRLFLRDLHSTNGTAIGGEPLDPTRGEVELTAGQTFAAANVEIDWGEAGSASARAPEEPRDPLETLPADEEDVPLTQLSYRLDQGYRQSARIRITEVLSELFELIATEKSPDELAAHSCEFVHHCLKADSVVLLEDKGEGTALEPLGSWTASGTPTEEINLDVVKSADWVIDLGPEGGGGGGQIVAAGTPETVAKARRSRTGSFLKSMLRQ